MNPQLTVITAVEPKRLSKSFKLDPKRGLIKIPGGQLVEGEAKRVLTAGSRELATILQMVTPGQALVYGVTDHEIARVVTQKALAASAGNGGMPVISRTREHFKWPEGSSILMFDYDPPDGCEPLSADAFRLAVYEICPAIEKAPHVIRASASSFIYHGEKMLRGASGWRMLVLVADGRDIPRAGAAFFDRCWLKGKGHIDLSKAGSFLERALVDSSVWQPERLDFCGGAYCFPPLQQKRPEPQFFNPDAEPLDSRTTIRSLTLPEQAEKKNLVAASKGAAEPAALTKRAVWIRERIQDALEGVPEVEREAKEKAVRETYSQAVMSQALLADFVLQPESGAAVTVGELLDDPERWHMKRFADPLEPEYQMDSRIAVANLYAAGRPYIFSHAHGGRRFTLHRVRQSLLVIKGERVKNVEQALELMRLNGQHFVRGGELVKISADGNLFPRDAQGICYDLDGLVRCTRWNDRKKEVEPIDCPPPIATGVCASQTNWKLPILESIATAPLIDPQTGRLIDRDGYDPGTRTMMILHDLARWPGVPDNPGELDSRNAAKTLWIPFEKFPFVGPIDRGVMLAAVLTAVIRALLKTAPAFAFDAPVAASGKTLLARCLSELAGDSPPTVFPIAEKEDEIRKRLLAILRSNRRVVVVDNAINEIESAALCAFLTNEVYGDRLLGESIDLRFPSRVLFILTGNNLALRGDLCRRVLTARIDPKMEQPWTRRFNLDPAEHCREHRLEIVAAALTILRAGIQKGREMPDRTASFEGWSDTIHRAVMYVKECGALDVEDPIQSINTALSEDSATQNLKALLTTWFDEWKSADVTVSTLVGTALKKAEAEEPDDTLLTVLKEIAPGAKGVNNQKLGRWLEQNRDRIVDGLQLASGGHGHRGARVWRVKSKEAGKNKGEQTAIDF